MKRALIALFVAATPLHGQTSRTDPTDLQAWTAVAAAFDLPNRWEASLQYRVRFDTDASSYRGSYISTEGGRRVTDLLTAFAGYRLALLDGATSHRFSAGVQGERDVGDITLSLRPTLQLQYKNLADSDEGASSTIVRLRLRAKYDLSNAWDIYASTEPYSRFGADYPIDNWKNTVGMRYEITDGVRIDGFYIYRPDYAKSYNRTFHIIGLELEFAVKP